MTVTAPPEPPPTDPGAELLDGTRSRARRVRSALAQAWLVGSFVLAVVPLVFIVAYVLREGLSAISWEFITGDISPSRRRAGGIGPAIYGTLLITGTATVMAVPLGVLGAVYLHEYGATGRLAKLIRFMSDVMSGVPSIVMGLFIYTIWVLNFGQSAFAGALALGALMLPIIIRSTEEMLRLVPDELRQGAYALGTRKSRTILTIVLPAALGGIVSGAMLAVARAAGETAPILFTVGITYSLNPRLFEGQNAALPTLIFNNAQLPFPDAQQVAYGSALTLVVIVFVLTILARVIASRFSIKET
jgi:phosphate transport system permease protein